MLFSTGQRFHTPYLSFIIGNTSYKNFDNRHDQNGRVAFIAGKKLGGAVWRNKAKRRMRALCLDLGGPWDNKDIVFLAKLRVIGSSYSKVLKACEKALIEADVIKETK